MTANGDHTPLSLACAGGHADVVKFLLACDADPFRKLKDNSTTLIEAAKGGHTAVVQLLLDYPHSVMLPRGNDACLSPVYYRCVCIYSLPQRQYKKKTIVKQY